MTMNLKSPGMFGRALASAALLATFSLPAYAQLMPSPFTVNEGGIPGTPPNTVQADRVNGSYVEIFTTTAPGAFSTTGYFSVGSFTQGSSTVGSVFLNSPEPSGYRLYATFNSVGTIVTSGGDTRFIGTTGDAANNRIDLFASPLSNVSLNSANGTVTPGAGDILLAQARGLQAGEGNIRGGLNNGDFELVFNNFTLTDQGRQYFVAPNPFYAVIDVNGNFANFDVPAVGGSVRTEGSANAFFVRGQVPEPGSIALMSIALLGLAGVTRRRKH